MGVAVLMQRGELPADAFDVLTRRDVVLATPLPPALEYFAGARYSALEVKGGDVAAAQNFFKTQALVPATPQKAGEDSKKRRKRKGDEREEDKRGEDVTAAHPLTVNIKIAPAAGSKAPTLSLAEINKFTVPKLKAALKERNLPVTGLKAVLKARLLEALGY